MLIEFEAPGRSLIAVRGNGAIPAHGREEAMDCNGRPGPRPDGGRRTARELRNGVRLVYSLVRIIEFVQSVV